MRELILKMFISLDGFVGSTDGIPRVMMNPPDPVGKAWNAERAWDTSLHVVGSNTFRGGPAIGRPRPMRSPRR